MRARGGGKRVTLRISSLGARGGGRNAYSSGDGPPATISSPPPDFHRRKAVKHRYENEIDPLPTLYESHELASSGREIVFKNRREAPMLMSPPLP